MKSTANHLQTINALYYDIKTKLGFDIIFSEGNQYVAKYLIHQTTMLPFNLAVNSLHMNQLIEIKFHLKSYSDYISLILNDSLLQIICNTIITYLPLPAKAQITLMLDRDNCPITYLGNSFLSIDSWLR